MATEKVGIYRKYHGPPVDKSGQPLPECEWPRKRPFSWAVRWFGVDGKRYSKSFTSRKEAERFSEAKQLEVRQGKADPPAPQSLREFSRTYLEVRGDLSRATRCEHARTLAMLQRHLGGQRLVRDVSPLDARRFVSWYRQRDTKGRTVAVATVNKAVRECRRIFREAVDCGLIRANPFTGIRQEKTPKSDWHYISPTEYRSLLASCRCLKWRGLIVLGYCCGLRLGEMLNLTWQDIDFEADRLKVVAKRAEADRQAWTPKDKDARDIPLPKDAVNILVELLHQAKEGQLYVFVNGKGPAAGQRLKRQNIWRDFQAIRGKAGLPSCTMHDLRRSYCTNLAGAVPMHVVQELAGHSDIRTTRQFYLRVQPQLLNDARRAVDAITQG